MMVGYVYDPVYLEHDTGEHPENAARLEAIMSRLEESGLKAKLRPIPPRAATIEEIVEPKKVLQKLECYILNRLHEVFQHARGFLQYEQPESESP